MADTTSMFASLEGLPTTMGGGETYKNMNPISKGVPLPATSDDRAYKAKYDTDDISVTTEGFTVFMSLEAHPAGANMVKDKSGKGFETPPQTFFRFTIGKTPTYSFYFGEDAPSYNFIGESIIVNKITINRKKQTLEVKFSDGVASLKVKKNKMMWKYADKGATNGYFYDDSLPAGMGIVFMGIAPYNALTATQFRENVNDLIDIIGTMISEGNGVYCWDADTAKTHFSPQSFTFNDTLDKEFLRTPEYNFNSLESLDTKSAFVSFTVAVENARKRTNNYTGRNSADTDYLVNLQFPGDEELLAPMGVGEDGTTVACGIESPTGRVLKSITPVLKEGMVEQVKLDFRDGSHYIFPDAETGNFVATDKEFPNQMLEGKVMNLIVSAGNHKDSYVTEKKTRIENDIDTSKTVIIDGKIETKAIAWKSNSVLKVIVPNPDGKGSKLVTIPLKKEA